MDDKRSEEERLDELIPRLAGISEGSAVAVALRDRQLIMDLTAASRQAVLRPADPGGLAPALRAALATRIATSNGEDDLASHYRASLDSDPDGHVYAALCDPSAQPPAGDAWLTATVRHADLLTQRPQDATGANIEAIRAAGVTDADVVRLTQLCGFLNYEARLIVGLRLLNTLGGS